MTDPAPPAAGVSSAGDLPASTYRRMAGVLRLGLAVALALLAGGLLALLAQSSGSDAGGWVHSNPLVGYLDPVTFAAGLAAGAPAAYLTLGVYALVATPVVRVATGIAAFAGHGERRMTALTVAVMVLLLFGLLVVGPLVR